ncbi:MAG: DUF2183 domain-containing protein [Verrucomicrobiales bacterium]|nr:DUF2183 domain-containing protein [Verrucomicrobiales bacterium]
MEDPEKFKARNRNYLRLFALQLEKVYDAFHRFLAWATGRLGKPMVAEIYHATPIAGGVAVKGRVLLARKSREPRPDDHPLVNLFQMMKRWATPERPRSLVRATVGGTSMEQIADGEGYFDIEIPTTDDKADTLLIELPNSEASGPAEHSLYEVGKDYQCVIISDIDDTVLITHAAKRLRMIATTLLGNALTRQLFPGSPELYRALRNGPDEEQDQANPITYVTSSPFNLHSLLHLIFEENDLPNGPFFMTDWGLDVDKWFSKSHGEHKIEAIETALEWFPEKPVILIGDSGQHDTMIYVDIALTHPHRVDQILIRDVTDPERLSELQEKVDRIKEQGTRFSFFSDSAEAAEILAERGWISSGQNRRVRDAVDNADPPLFHLGKIQT